MGLNVKHNKTKIKKATEKERIKFLREAILSSTESHGAPCGCMLCEALLFDYMASNGEINLKTGERN